MIRGSAWGTHILVTPSEFPISFETKIGMETETEETQGEKLCIVLSHLDLGKRNPSWFSTHYTHVSPSVLPSNHGVYNQPTLFTSPHRTPFSQLYSSEPCTTHQESLGPIVLTLRRSHVCYTLGRRQIFRDFSSVRYSMVCRTPSSAFAWSTRSIVLGIVIVLFFRCMSALLINGNRQAEGIKWPLVAHIISMFSFATIITAMNLYLQHISYIDYRAFNSDGPIPSGPLGYQISAYSKAIDIIPSIMFILNQWLADGLVVSLVSTSSHLVFDVGHSLSYIVAAFCIT